MRKAAFGAAIMQSNIQFRGTTFSRVGSPFPVPLAATQPPTAETPRNLSTNEQNQQTIQQPQSSNNPAHTETLQPPQQSPPQPSQTLQPPAETKRTRLMAPQPHLTKAQAPSSAPQPQLTLPQTHLSSREPYSPSSSLIPPTRLQPDMTVNQNNSSLCQSTRGGSEQYSVNTGPTDSETPGTQHRSITFSNG